ncbi:MAG: MoaD/ThiS family protein [Formosimonas sp.]
MLTFQIALYGVFRNCGVSSVTLHLPAASRVAQIKSQLGEQLAHDYPNFDAAGWLAAAVLANETRVLRDDEVLAESMHLAILPPVCGG